MTRPKDMHTKDYLARELRAAGLDAMADRAAEGYYHDFLSPLTFPDLMLDKELHEAALLAGNKAAADLRRRHHNGEFDASREESDDWAASPDGQAAFKELIRPKP